MKSVAVDKRWLVLPIYLLSGLALGLVNPQLRLAAQQLGVQPGWGTAANVNLLLPLIAISLAVAWPRLITVWLGALTMAGAFHVGLVLANPHLQPWDLATLLGSVHPILVLSCLGYAVLGTLAVLIVRTAWK
jgi:hypothetical protein